MVWTLLALILAAQPVAPPEPASPRVGARKDAPQPPPRIELVDPKGTPLTLEERARVLPALSRWLGVEVQSEQVTAALSVTETDGRWPFSSLVSKDDPAWAMSLHGIVFTLGERKTSAFDLLVLIRQSDSALLGVRSRWPHEDLGVQVIPKTEKEFREDLAGQSECWSGVGVTAKSNLRDVLAHICDNFGGPLTAEYLCAYVVAPYDVCPGGATICARPELGPAWSVELGCLASTKPSLAFGMDRPNLRGRDAQLIVSHNRHIVIDTPLGSGCSSTWPRPVVQITTANGDVENRNWWDGSHPPPFGLVKKPEAAGAPKEHSASDSTPAKLSK